MAEVRQHVVNCLSEQPTGNDPSPFLDQSQCLDALLESYTVFQLLFLFFFLFLNRPELSHKSPPLL